MLLHMFVCKFNALAAVFGENEVSFFEYIFIPDVVTRQDNVHTDINLPRNYFVHYVCAGRLL